MKTTWFFLVFVISTHAVGQNWTVFIDDTMFVERHYIYRYVLKDSLKDGMWYLHDQKRIDSAKADQTTLIMSVEYKNQLKQGPLLHFRYDHRRGELLIRKREEYVDGEKDGLFFSESGITGGYKAGLPHGLWTRQYEQGFWVCGRKNKMFRSRLERMLNISSPNFFTCRFHRRFQIRQGVEEVVSYDNGIVQQWHRMSRIDGRIYEIGVGNLTEGKCYIVILRESGVLFKEYFFEDGGLTRFLVYFENGHIFKDFVYDSFATQKPNQNCLRIDIQNQYSFWLYEPTPCDGFIIEYDESGNEISITEYRDGEKI